MRRKSKDRFRLCVLSLAEFETTNKMIKGINKDLTKAINGIREDNFTEASSVDILGSFAVYLGRQINHIIESQVFVDIIAAFMTRIREIQRSIPKKISSEELEVIWRFLLSHNIDAFCSVNYVRNADKKNGGMRSFFERFVSRL